MPNQNAFIAVNRFGLGARVGEADRISEPRSWLSRQTRDRNAFLMNAPGLMNAEQASDALFAYREERQAARQAKADGSDMPATATASVVTAPQQMPLKQLNEIARADIEARANHALTTDSGFAERLVYFWSNHFTVAAVKAAAIPYVGVFEREAIRPNLTGKFSDLLLASTRHPGMLAYLDQAQSIGPNSIAGQRRQAGLNENLAREIMELHTVGVHAGYSQVDVTEFARALTGWTISGARTARFAPNSRTGDFIFVDAMHELGARAVMDRKYAPGGEDQARAILLDLAHRPATAKHIATKLARHFIADDPPSAAVSRIETAFAKSGGDLPAIHEALIACPEAWTLSPGKFKSPNDFLISALRLTGIDTVDIRQLNGAFSMLGQAMYRADSPAGWADDAATWANANAVMKRLEWSQALAQRVTLRMRPEELARAGLGPSLSERSIQAISRADSPAQGLVLALMSPEFQRR